MNSIQNGSLITQDSDLEPKKSSRTQSLTFYLGLLNGNLFLLLLDDGAHVVHVIGSSDELDFLEAASRDLQIHLVVLVSLREVLDLL